MFFNKKLNRSNFSKNIYFIYTKVITMTVNGIEALNLYTTTGASSSKDFTSLQNTSATSTQTNEDEYMALDLSSMGLEDLGTLLEETQKSQAELLKEQYELTIAQIQMELEEARRERNSLSQQMQSSTLGEEGGNSSNIFAQFSEINSKINKLNNELLSTITNYEIQLQKLSIQAKQTEIQLQSLVSNAQTLSATTASTSTAATSTSASGIITTNLDNYNTQAGQKIAQSALTVDGTTGWCLRGVNDSLERVYGKRLSYNSAYQAIPELQSNQGLGAYFQEVSVTRAELSSLPAGSIVVWEASAGHEHGHISIALGDGRESSDHITSQMTGRDANFHVFVPIA